MKKTYAKPELSKRGVFSIVTAAPGDSGDVVPSKVSDIRLKKDIKRVGVAANGLPLYHFKYIGGDVVYRGVMAQDVLEVFPEAVCTMPNGFLAVHYDMLGLSMTRVR